MRLVGIFLRVARNAVDQGVPVRREDVWKVQCLRVVMIRSPNARMDRSRDDEHDRNTSSPKLDASG